MLHTDGSGFLVDAGERCSVGAFEESRVSILSIYIAFTAYQRQLNPAAVKYFYAHLGGDPGTYVPRASRWNRCVLPRLPAGSEPAHRCRYRGAKGLARHEPALLGQKSNPRRTLATKVSGLSERKGVRLLVRRRRRSHRRGSTRRGGRWAALSCQSREQRNWCMLLLTYIKEGSSYLRIFGL